MFDWLLRLFGRGRAEVKETVAEVKTAVVDEVAERREAMETKATAAKAKVAAAKETATTKAKAVKSATVGLATMTKTELLAHAKKVKVKVASNATKAVIIAKIKEAAK